MARRKNNSRTQLAEQAADDALVKQQRINQNREAALAPDTQYAEGTFSVPLRGESSLRSSKNRRLRQTHKS